MKNLSWPTCTTTVDPSAAIDDLSVKLDKVPELLQGVIPEDPVNVKFEAVAAALGARVVAGPRPC